MNHVMLDLETMSTAPNAAIVAIGAVCGEETFYLTINLQSCVDYGLHIDANTVCWWLQQCAEARKDVATGTYALHHALEVFSSWLSELPEGDTYIWGNGADFDNVILANAYKATGLDLPWSHRNNRCFRTLKAMYPNIKHTFDGIAHNALADAFNQARHLEAILKVHSGNGI